MSGITCFIEMVSITGCHIVMVDCFIMDHLWKDDGKSLVYWKLHCSLQLFSISEKFKA